VGDGMNTDKIETYHHTQNGPWYLLLYAFTAALLTAGWFVSDLALQITLLVAGLLMYLLAVSFRHLTVADEGNYLAIRFGPLPLFRKRILYDDIRGVETGRTTILDGWGIHWNPWGGLVWNIWGFGCVVIRLKRSAIRVGTDDPEGLVAFLRSRIATQEPAGAARGSS
jgi:hypothetical protein